MEKRYRRSWRSGFKGLFRVHTIGITSTAYLTDATIAAPGATKLSAIENNLQVQAIPEFPREETLQVFLSLYNVFSVGQPPALCQTMYMGVHGESGHAKSLRHDYAGGFVADPGEALKSVHVLRDDAIVFIP